MLRINSMTTMGIISMPFKDLFLLFAILSIGFCYCEGRFKGSYQKCTFYYGYDNLNCTDYRFDQCQWDQCVSYVTVGNDTYCDRYQTFSDLNWGSCSNRCCYQSFPNEYASFQKCDDHVKSLIMKVLIIVFSVFGGIIFIIIVGCLICKCRDRFSSCFHSIRDCCRGIGQCVCYVLTCGCFKQAENKHSLPPIKITMTVMATWTVDGVHNQKLNETCCICLQPAPSLQLECGHIYHRSCIITCLNKKEQCVLCRSVNVERAKIYCQQCHMKYYMINIKQSKQTLLGQQQLCDTCKQCGL